MRLRSVLSLPVTLALAAGTLQAQAIPFSQHGAVSQTVAFTDITVVYNRPVARGRTLFPEVVKWDRVWNPGADSATMVRFSRDVMVEGKAVAAGEYSVWMIPQASGPWTLILHRDAHVFHTPYPGAKGDLFRLPVTPERGAHMETLAFYFPVVVRDSTVLRMHWGETVVPIRIRAPATP